MKCRIRPDSSGLSEPIRRRLSERIRPLKGVSLNPTRQVTQKQQSEIPVPNPASPKDQRRKPDQCET